MFFCARVAGTVLKALLTEKGFFFDQKLKKSEKEKKMRFEQFRELAVEYDFIPVYEVMTADLYTPVIAYLKLRREGRQSFLLETVEGKETLGRYSFIGIDPVRVISNRGMMLSVTENGVTATSRKNIFDHLKEDLHTKKHPALPELPAFTGGTVGFIGYENISLIESRIKYDEGDDALPDSILGVYETVVAFDHYKHRMIIISNAAVTPGCDLQNAYSGAKSKIRGIKQELREDLHYSSHFKFRRDVAVSIEDPRFHEMVEKCKENIVEGDIFQIVLSKRFSAGYTGDLFSVYRALRMINPSPYMYFLEFTDGLTIIGTSPENLVKVKDGMVEVMPIAGTRKRGATPEEDAKLEDDLVNDPKEQAEHVMLVDLGRNDVGRVSEFGTVEVVEKMNIHRFSHVMHIVSRVRGKLRGDLDCIDALKSCFPAGTVSGAPKIRAMELIAGYENQRRNVYAGAVGYIDLSGNLDVCIAIRTLFARDGVINWQAGAGIVADSIPRLESKEINNKSAVLRNALELAEVVDEDSGN